MTGHQPGDRVPVVYQRGGQTLQTEVVLSAGQSFYTHRVERDPCKVFIGVYTSDMGAGEPGVRVSGVIEDTPAKISGVQPGDIIVSLDGQPINSHLELRRERDKHQPGEAFRLTVLRDGASVDIDATFKKCEEPTPGDSPLQEVVEVLTEDVPATQRTDPGASLQVELNAFPNPTVGVLNIRFEAEPVPTTVSIQDVTGKAVYTTTLNQFSGSFNEQVNLYGNKPGTYVLSVRQGDKVYSRPVVLMPRA